MPWSEWIQTPEATEYRAPTKAASTGSDGSNSRSTPGVADEQIIDAQNSAVSGGSAATEIRPAPNSDTASVTQEFRSVYLPDPTKAVATAHLAQNILWYGLEGDDTRDLSPALFDGLVYGVDYGPRPDRNEDTDPDAFVEYEDGAYLLQPGDLRGWDGDATITVLESAKDSTDPINGAGRIYRTDTALDPPDGPLGSTAVAVVPPGGGSTVAEVLGKAGTSGGTSTGTFVLGGDVTLFSLVTEPSFAPFLYTDGLYQTTLTTDITVRWRLLYPRWRYWIPETTVVFPLRQKQRNDGLARGALRARSTSSIQNSVRQNSYR